MRARSILWFAILVVIQRVNGDGNLVQAVEHPRTADIDGDGKQEVVAHLHKADIDGDGKPEQVVEHTRTADIDGDGKLEAAGTHREHAHEQGEGRQHDPKREHRTKTVEEGEKAMFMHAFAASFVVIIATEIGDKTFFIAAVLTMRHSRSAVWAGAVGALIVMTVFSTLVGHSAPLLLPPVITHYAAVFLFFFFGTTRTRTRPITSPPHHLRHSSPCRRKDAQRGA